MRRAALAIAAIALAVLASPLVYREVLESSLEKCEISLYDVRLREVGAASATLEVKLRVVNPGPLALRLSKLYYSLYVNDIYLGDGVVREGFEVPAGGSAIVSSELDLSYIGAVQALASIIKSGEAKWRINGTAYAETFLGPISASFEAGK